MNHGKPEYEILKCYVCGQEMKGRRIVRLTEEHKAQWYEKKRTSLKFELLMLPFIVPLMLGSLGLVLYFVDAVAEQEAFNWLVVSLELLAIGIPPIVYFCIKSAKADKWIARFLEDHYGVKRGEFYKII